MFEIKLDTRKQFCNRHGHKLMASGVLLHLGLNSLLESVFLGAVLASLVRVLCHIFLLFLEFLYLEHARCDVLLGGHGAAAHHRFMCWLGHEVVEGGETGDYIASVGHTLLTRRHYIFIFLMTYVMLLVTGHFHFPIKDLILKFGNLIICCALCKQPIYLLQNLALDLG